MEDAPNSGLGVLVARGAWISVPEESLFSSYLWIWIVAKDERWGGRAGQTKTSRDRGSLRPLPGRGWWAPS